jgi:regulator of sirC expression with transglutaminase-like and TPR domain
LNLERFQRLVDQDDAQVPLDQGALEIARIGHPDLDPAPSLARLDALAERLRSRPPAGAGLTERVDQLITFLFREEGFHGNQDDYYNPRNSYLNDVLERRVGIPILLGVVLLEVARRLEIPLQGVGFPGNFLVRARDGRQDRFLDPFRGGRVLGPEDCQSLLERALGPGVMLEGRFLEPVGPRAILARMLRNLKVIFASRHDGAHSLNVLDALLLLEPGNWTERRDRGKIRQDRGDLMGAAADLEGYLLHGHPDTDADEVRGLLQQVRRRLAMVN